MTNTENSLDLSGFNGSEKIYRHPLMPVKYTEGVQYLAEKAGAYWLLDKVASLQLEPKVKAEEFQAWKLELSHPVPGATRPAYLTCEDGNLKEVYREMIDYTDFPLPEVTIWLIDGVMLLPSEY